MDKKLVIAIIFSLLLASTVLWMASAGTNKSEKDGLPKSLDQHYDFGPIYLYEMYELGESMVGITVNIQQNDITNATRSFEVFAQEYDDSSLMVPEWRGYYKPNDVKKMGDALDAGNIPGVFAAMGEVGETCARCHVDTMSDVYNKYYWSDFRNVEIDTPEGPKPWVEAKMKYLLTGFDGIGINIKQGNQSNAEHSFNLFELMFDNMAEACSSCHDSEPRYYISDDIQTMIDDMGSNITAGNLSNAEIIRHGIGSSCHKCHIIHIPPQYAKLDGK